MYSEHTFLTLGCQETTTYTSLSPNSSSAVHSLHSNTFAGEECCCILDAYVPGCVYILYSEGSYETVHSLQSMHLFPLVEIHLTVNWQDGQTALMSTSLNQHLYVSIASVWYITGTEWYIYVASSPGSPLNQSLTFDPA